ncbi:HlyD family efflux transporter periplasmic adaptor subunit [Kangiella sp.]|uniref:HlyD family secretion protein n=1 Tax=Kangiella sp. TaxID=1920245 RepID=UPI0019ADE24E|nr:HlyD family efflux transporter periplasmic adaptor subunit [Kangiella sp.]MBD3654104.1 HlyD family efflux transporter periplasmic adaptor subunit [Kangiella sp.]
MEDVKLYRQEAVDNSSSNMLGSVVVKNQPLSLAFVLFFLAIVLSMVLFLIQGTYSKKQIVNGYILPNKGALKVYAPYLGTVDKKLVIEGDYVKKGDAILQVATGRYYAGGHALNEQLIKEVETQIDSLLDRAFNQEEINASETEQLHQQIANLSDELSKLSVQIKTQRELVKVNKNEWSKYIDFRKRGLVREAEVSSRHSTYLTHKANLESLKRVILNKELELSQAEKQLSQLPVKAKERQNELESTLARLKERIIELKGASSYIVKAPVSGRVTAMQVNAGQTVSPNKPLLTIIPEDTVLYAELYLPSRAIGFVNEGQKVLLRYDAFPYQRYGLYEGTVSNIASSVINPNEASNLIQLQEPVYKVNVELKSQYVTAYDKKMILQSGMSVNADIILGERSLVEWLLEPIYSLRGKI